MRLFWQRQVGGGDRAENETIKMTKSLYHGHRFPAIVISCAIRWYFRFNLNLRDIEELLLERGVVVTCETIRCWCNKFGAAPPCRLNALLAAQVSVSIPAR